MGQELTVTMQFKNRKTGVKSEFLMAYWRKGWSMTDEIIRFINDTASSEIISEDEQSYILESNFIYSLKDFLYEQLGDTESYSFSNSFWGSYTCYQQTIRQFRNITAWIQFYANRFNVLDEIENATASDEQPCFDGCFDPDALGDMFVEYSESEAKDKEKEFIYILHHLGDYDITIEVLNSY